MKLFEQWPAAHGAGVIKARLKATPEDFIVREHLGFEADGDGDHMLLIVRKRGANSMWVAKQLARYGKLDARDVGFSGLKDRHAITEQAYTVPSRTLPPEFWLDAQGEGWQVIHAARIRRKLKRGAHKANDFDITLTDVRVSDEAALQQRLVQIRDLGVPNYFGPQRFGNEANNLVMADEWFIEGREPRERFQRGFALSAARALIFNEVLAARIANRTWDRLLPGDVANLNGSNSVFVVNEVDDVLIQRCREMDIHPTGPLWGSGELATQGAVTAAEQHAADAYASMADGLVRNGLCHERRALRMAVRNFTWTREDDRLILKFRLTKGAFATTVIAELFGDTAMDCGEEDDV